MKKLHDFRAYSDKVNYVFEGAKFPKGGPYFLGNMEFWPGGGANLGGGQISWDTGQAFLR